MNPHPLVSPVDHAALRVNQAAIVLLLIVAFVFNAPWLGAAVFAVMALGTLRREPGFRFIYAGVLRPLGLVRPALVAEAREPHLFAQGLGAGVLGAALVTLWLGQWLVGWALAWVVIALAALNLTAGFCAGCAVYYWLARLGVPAFRRPAPRQER